MGSTGKLAIVSDIHYAGESERQTGHRLYEGVDNRLVYWLLRAYRHFIWMRDSFAHNHLLDRFLDECGSPDFVIANGDYCCNNAYVGVSDPDAFASAAECLGKLREAFPDRLLAISGDHDLGKTKIGSTLGGLRLASFQRLENGLGIKPFWQVSLGQYLLVGVTSSLLALPLLSSEALPEELETWEQLRREHVNAVEKTFGSLQPSQRILLFCHDPSALPFLYQIPAVRERLAQIERVVIGHLHSKLILFQSRFLGFVPQLNFGQTSRRITAALRQVHYWKHFKLLLCPSLAGIELVKAGGFYTAVLDLAAEKPARFELHPMRREFPIKRPATV